MSTTNISLNFSALRVQTEKTLQQFMTIYVHDHVKSLRSPFLYFIRVMFVLI